MTELTVTQTDADAGKDGRTRSIVILGAVFVIAFAVRWVTLPGLQGDDHWPLWTAATFLKGDLPFRDFVDLGDPLYWGMSALAQAIAGYRVVGEVVLGTALVAFAFAVAFHLAWRASGSLPVAAGLTVLAVLVVTERELYSYPKLFVYPLALWFCWRYIDCPTLLRSAALAFGVAVAFGGEFNWSSQHLDDEVLQCRDGNGEGQTGRVGLRCVRLVGRRQRGVRSSNGSGRRSRGGCRVRMPLCPVACRRPWVVVGSVRAVVCRRSAWRPDRLATCPLRSGKRSRSCELRAPGCVTLPVGSGEPRRLSRESYVATRRLGAAVWRIGRRLRSGTAPDVPSARR